MAMFFCLSVWLSVCYVPARREGGNKRCFCQSVRLSVRTSRIIREPKGLACPLPKFGRKVPHLCHEAINAHTHRAPYLPNGKVYELQTWYPDGGQQPASATGAMTSKVKGQGRKVTWSVGAVLAQCFICVIRGWRRHTVSAEPDGHTSCFMLTTAI